MDAAPVGDADEVPASPYSTGNDRDRHPVTYLPNTSEPGIVQEKVFDPALKHVDHAFRAGEPVFTDADLGTRWWEANQRALELALQAIAGTPWRGSLVLRGSMLMPVWVGDAARRPSDLDFVVSPAETTPFGDPAERMFTGIGRAGQGGSSGHTCAAFLPHPYDTTCQWEVRDRPEAARAAFGPAN